MVVTKISQQVGRKDRYSIFIDDTFAFGVSEQALLDLGISRGQSISKEQLEAITKTVDLDTAYQKSVDLILRRPRSTWEIATYLKRKGTQQDAINKITLRLKARNLLDDLEFARRWVDNRRLLKHISYKKLRLELMQKHVDSVIIEQALQLDETDERQVLRELATKKRQHARYQDDTKLVRYLAGQGYNYSDIKAVISGDSD